MNRTHAPWSVFIAYLLTALACVPRAVVGAEIDRPPYGFVDVTDVVPDLEKKLAEFRAHYNECRVHSSLGGHTPAHFTGERVNRQATLYRFRWQGPAAGSTSYRSQRD